MPGTHRPLRICRHCKGHVVNHPYFSFVPCRGVLLTRVSFMKQIILLTSHVCCELITQFPSKTFFALLREEPPCVSPCQFACHAREREVDSTHSASPRARELYMWRQCQLSEPIWAVLGNGILPTEYAARPRMTMSPGWEGLQPYRIF